MTKDSWDLYEIDVTTRSQPRPLIEVEFDQFPGSWSADGTLLAYGEEHPVTGADIWVYPQGQTPVPVVQTPTLLVVGLVSEYNKRVEI